MPTAIRVTESTPGAARAILGSKLPLAAERPRRGDFILLRTPDLPPFDAIVLGEDDELTIEPSEESSTVHAPAKLLLVLVKQLPGHERGIPCSDPAAIERRLAHANTWTGLDELPSRHPVDVLDVQRVFVKEALRARLEKLALPTDVTVSSVARHPRVSFSEEELTILACELAASAALWPWDVDGARLDEAAAREEEERARLAQEAAELESREEAINTLSCGELNVVAVEDLRRPGSFRYFDKASAAGLGLPADIDYGRALRVHPADFVPAVPRRVLKQRWNFVGDLGFGQWGEGFFATQRKPHIDNRPITEFRDESTVGGRYARERAEALIPALAPRFLGGEVHVGLLIVHAILRGLSLRPDIAYEVLVDALEPLWMQLHPQDMKQRFTTAYDEDGREQRVPAPPPPMPPMPYPLASAEQFYEFAAKCIEGAGALVSPDELFGDGPTFDDAAAVGDPWREAIEAFVEGKAITTSADVVAHLRNLGLLEVGTAVGPRDHARIFRMMGRLGFKKVDVAGDIPNTRKKAFVRTSPATPATDGDGVDS